MARRPKEKYKPGELTRVKNNLGNISKDEALKMSKILGGEIGIEQTDKDIQDRYEELFHQTKSKSKDKWISQTSYSNTTEKEKKNTEINPIKFTYLEKIKLFYLASHPDHSIKTSKQTIRAVFDFFSKQKNYINPNLIKSSNYYFFKSIKTLVKSTRFMSKNIQKKYIKREENPFYWLITDAICAWDIESIQEEIFKLKQEPHNIALESWAPLIKLIYKPIILLSKLNRKKDIEGALHYLYKLSIDGLFKKDLKIDRLRKSYTLALGEIHNVFIIIKFRLYPLLLMFVSSKTYDYNTMFRLKGHEILNFLGLKAEDLITIFNDHTQKPDTIDNSQDESEKEITKKEQIQDLSIQKGIILLDKIFPSAGWNNLDKRPDMLPYFQPILNIPSEISLISPEDSLQRIVILIAILKDLFYGFSNFDYGFFVDDTGKPIELKEKMDLLIKNWYLFNDVLILKNYIGPLNEYCRHLERSIDLSETEYTKRIASDILWLKKTYLTPKMSLDLPKIMQPRTKTAIPKLYESVKELQIILKRMVSEIFSQGEIAIETIRNHEEESWFEIDNYVSKRLKFILKQENKKLTNKILILYTYEIIEVLNDILLSTDQEIEEKGISGLFRSEGSRELKPIYSVNSNNTFFKLKNNKRNNTFKRDLEVEYYDTITDFFGKKHFTNYLLDFIENYQQKENNFSLIHIKIHNFKSLSDINSVEIIQNTGKAITESIRLLKDIPFRTENDNFYIILPGKDTSLAIKVGNKIFSNRHNNEQLYVGVCEYRPPMESIGIMTHLENTILKLLPSPGVSYYDPEKDKYFKM